LSRRVLVVTGLHLGWDCVVGVFASEQAILDSWMNQELDEPWIHWEQFKNNELDGEYIVHEEILNF
jgi:hypothetical protein